MERNTVTTQDLPPVMIAARQTVRGPLEKTLVVNTCEPLPRLASQLPAGHALIKVAYTSLNPMDYKVAETPIISNLAFQGIPCLDFAGVVVRSKASGFVEGERVFGQTEPMNFGACAEFIVVASRLCNRVPDNVELRDAATIGIAALTAYQMIAPLVGLGSKNVLVNGGSGGLGTYGIQVAKALGCYVTAICSGANVALCESIGADHVIDYRSQDVIKALKRSSQQYDLVVDTIFSDGKLYWACHDFLKPEGVYVTIVSGLKWTFLKDISSITLWPSILGGGQRKFKLVGRKTCRKDYERLATWISEGKIRPIIEQVYGIDEVRLAFEKLKSGRARGKLAVRIT